jgi:DNA-binding HxlR family transcriptional regulator
MERRSYQQYCGVARALDLVGERWTLLIVRDLVLGPLRYSELLRGLPGITTNLLAKRLRELEDSGIIERMRSAASDGHSYRLTPLGAALEPTIQALARWGWDACDSPSPARGETRRFEWLLFALRGLYRGGETLRAELVADDAPYRILLTPGTADLSRGDVPGAELRIRGGATELAQLLMESPSRPRVPSGVEVEHGAGALRRLLAAFDTRALAFTRTAIKTT